MNVKVENVEKNVAVLEIEVLKEQFDEGLKKAYFKNKSHFMIPGFRKGKAPMNIVIRHYGEEVLYEDAINEVCPIAYDDAVKQENLEPVDRPEIDIKTIGNNENLVFTAKVTLKPDVKLGEYKAIEIEEKKAKVLAADIKEELKTLQERNARLIPVEDRTIEKGDTVNLDYEGFKDELPFEGGKAEGHNLEIGSNSFIPGFEDQLIGKRKGEEADINLVFPENYQQEDLAGQPVVFKIIINDIKKKELPELDDDFAQDVSEFETLDEYKKDIRKKLMETRKEEANKAMEKEVADIAAENAEVEVPDCMIERRIDNLIYEFDMTLRYQGMNFESYLGMIGSTKEEIRKQYKESAEKDVKIQLVIEQISKTEGIEATDDDIKKEIEEMATSYKKTVEEVEKTLTDDYREDIKAKIISKKTVDLLLKNAVKKAPDKEVKKKEKE